MLKITSQQTKQKINWNQINEDALTWVKTVKNGQDILQSWHAALISQFKTG